jgi:predicted aldo/keto reductase-like oxidoreductase
MEFADRRVSDILHFMVNNPQSASLAPHLGDLSKYIYGTTRLGDDKIPFDQRVKIARLAMDARVWFHTSHSYGDALKVLRAAFDEDRKHVPPTIVKIGWSNIDELRKVVQQNIEPLDVDHIDIGQLCLGGDYVEQFRSGGKCYDDFRLLKKEGLVRRFVVEVFPWTSKAPLEALRAGLGSDVIDGYIFYLNPLQRFASNELWDLIQAKNAPIIAMRTVSGGDVHRLRDVPGAAWKDYLRQRAVEVAPIFERSGCKTWTEFCVRFAFGFKQVRATVGATSKEPNLQAFLGAAKDIKPLSLGLQSEIVRLQYRWSDEVDIHAEPWSM